MAQVPSYDRYMAPIVASLRKLGGSAAIQELYEAVVDEMKLTEEQLAVLHDETRSGQTEAGYRMAWARTYLKKAGVLTNSERGVWALTKKGFDDEVDPQAVVDTVRAGYDTTSPDLRSSPPAPLESEPTDDMSVSAPWRQDLLQAARSIEPAAFERLCQRILRESGFVEVRVTGKSGDGGIDGIGILRLQRMVSFQVYFQCKRYRGAVGSKEIRDFRGSMVGRSDKGLFMTTGHFTRRAMEEATRDGAPPIDLIDGEQLVDLLRELGLGVRVEKVEQIVIDAAWFGEI